MLITCVLMLRCCRLPVCLPAYPVVQLCIIEPFFEVMRFSRFNWGHIYQRDVGTKIKLCIAYRSIRAVWQFVAKVTLLCGIFLVFDSIGLCRFYKYVDSVIFWKWKTSMICTKILLLSQSVNQRYLNSSSFSLKERTLDDVGYLYR